jgi:hypothetical protein
MRKAMTIGFAAMALCLVAPACTKVTPSDAGPPVLTWNVRTVATGATQDITGNGSIQAKLGDTYTVIFKAESPGGVHKVTLGGSATWGCIADGLGQTSTADELTDIQSDSSDAQGKVLDTLFLIRNRDLNFTCSSGFTFSDGTSVLNGTGENYFGKVATATLLFKVSP